MHDVAENSPLFWLSSELLAADPPLSSANWDLLDCFTEPEGHYPGLAAYSEEQRGQQAALLIDQGLANGQAIRTKWPGLPGRRFRSSSEKGDNAVSLASSWL